MAAGLWGHLPRSELAASAGQAGSFACHAIAQGQQGGDAENAGTVRGREVGGFGPCHPERHEELTTVGRLGDKRRRWALVHGCHQQMATVERVEAVAD